MKIFVLVIRDHLLRDPTSCAIILRFSYIIVTSSSLSKLHIFTLFPPPLHSVTSPLLHLSSFLITMCSFLDLRFLPNFSFPHLSLPLLHLSPPFPYLFILCICSLLLHVQNFIVAYFVPSVSCHFFILLPPPLQYSFIPSPPPYKDFTSLTFSSPHSFQLSPASSFHFLSLSLS